MQTEIIELELDDVIKIALKEYPPKIPGGCFHASNYIKEFFPLFNIKLYRFDELDLPHCVLETPDGMIIDTQHLQLYKLGVFKKSNKYIFTQDEYEELMIKNDYN